MNPPENELTSYSFTRLGESFRELFYKYNDRTFMSAINGIGCLGLKLRLDDNKLAEIFFKHCKRMSNSDGIKDQVDSKALEIIITAIIKAWKVRETALSEYIPQPHALQFSAVKYLLKIN